MKNIKIQGRQAIKPARRKQIHYISKYIKYMSPSEYTSMSFCKEINKLVGTNNFLAWKKSTDLLLKENQLLEHVKGNITILVKEHTEALAKYNKDETRA